MSEQQQLSLWKKEEQILHADCRIYKIFRSRFTHPIRKSSGDFFVMEGSSWALCLPVNQAGEILLVRQFRFGSESLSWEVPGGCMEKGEDPILSATRELAEETGYTGTTYVAMGDCSPNPALQNNRVHFVLARDVTKTKEIAWDEHEEIEAQFFSLEQVLQMIKSGEIFHALTINTIFYYQNFHLES